MDVTTILYICYFAKALAEFSVYFVWLVDSTSKTIQYIAAVVTLLAICPFFHVTTLALSTRPTLVLSETYFIAYLCFSAPLGALWFEPTRHGIRRIIPLSIVSTLDALSLYIFLYSKGKLRHSGPSVTDEEHEIGKAKGKALEGNSGRAPAGEITADQHSQNGQRGIFHEALDGRDVGYDAQFASRVNGAVIGSRFQGEHQEQQYRQQYRQHRDQQHQEQQHQEQQHQDQQHQEQQHREQQHQQGIKHDGALEVEDQTREDGQSSLAREKETAALKGIQGDQQYEEDVEGLYGIQEQREMVHTRNNANTVTRGMFQRPQILSPTITRTAPGEIHPALRSKFSTSELGTPEAFETPRRGASPQHEEDIGEGMF